ncbi:MAG TPA: hypothetical protein VFE28_15445, partial [Candidatus Krumholzibacteria bacterium]|nr:hypothetical protein [Candidatus Krumholzibacteria bacterium]
MPVSFWSYDESGARRLARLVRQVVVAGAAHLAGVDDLPSGTDGLSLASHEAEQQEDQEDEPEKP